MYIKFTEVDIQDQPRKQSERPAVSISNLGMINKGIVHKRGFRWHFIKYKKIYFLEGNEFQLFHA